MILIVLLKTMPGKYDVMNAVEPAIAALLIYTSENKHSFGHVKQVDIYTYIKTHFHLFVFGSRN